MALRDHLEADLATFVNVDEFGKTHAIGYTDGVVVEVPCVLMEQEEGQQEGMGLEAVTIHLRSADLPAELVVQQRITIDDRPAQVTSVEEAEGMLAIGLQWWTS